MFMMFGQVANREGKIGDQQTPRPCTQREVKVMPVTMSRYDATPLVGLKRLFENFATVAAVWFTVGMWTAESRGRMAGIEKKTKRYPSDLTDAEWSAIAPFCRSLPGLAAGGRPIFARC
jgi:hypothetical protein